MSEFKVTPWEVEGEVDYDKLIEEFGTQRINQNLNMRPVPRLRFIEERKTEEAGRIEEILEELKKEKK